MLLEVNSNSKQCKRLKNGGGGLEASLQSKCLVKVLYRGLDDGLVYSAKLPGNIS